MSACVDDPTPRDVPQGLTWGYKLVGLDLATDDRRGGRFRYRPGEWHEADPGGRAFTDGDCPSFPGDGLCVARSLSGAQSGGARVGASVMLLVGYRESDVLGESSNKVRVRRLLVHPDPQDPVAWLTGPGAYLRGAGLRDAYLRDANLGGVDLRGAYLRGVDLRDANLGGVDLEGADLRDADLEGANLEGANLGSARPSWLPAWWAVAPDGYVVKHR